MQKNIMDFKHPKPCPTKWLLYNKKESHNLENCVTPF